MASNSLTFTRKSPLSLRFTGCSRIPTSHFASQTRIPAKPVQISGLRSCSSCNYGSYVLNFSHGKAKFNDLGSLEIGNKQSGPDYFLVFAVSESSTGGHGGSGNGNFGSNGGGGGGGDGAAGASGGGSNWSLLSWYLSLLAKYPVWTKAVTSALLTFTGDLTCQLLIDKVPSLDIKRIFLFTFLGLVLVGPTLHFWYLYLSKLVTVPGAAGTFLSLLLDQFVFSPMFIGVFLSALVTLEGRPSQVVPKLQQEWFSAVLANWQLWIPFQFLNFRYVPQQFQVLAANLIALIWNIILSYKAHREVLTK